MVELASSPKNSSTTTESCSPTAPFTSHSTNIRCEVADCKSLRFSRVSALKRHWVLSHQQTILMSSCLVAGCRYKNPREDKVRDHASKQHPQAFADDLDRKMQLQSLPQTVDINRRFINPGSIKPPSSIVPLINPHPSEYARLKRIPAIYSPSVQKRKSAQEVPEYVPTKIQRTDEPTISYEVALKEYGANDKEIKRLTERNSFLKRFLKEHENTQLNLLKKTAKHQEEKIRELRDEIRRKDRAIRHLEADKHKVLN